MIILFVSCFKKNYFSILYLKFIAGMAVITNIGQLWDASKTAKPLKYGK